MDVRDAVEGDAEALAELTDVPPGVLENVVHDRTVRVLVDDAGADGSAAADETVPDEADESAEGTAPDVADEPADEAVPDAADETPDGVVPDDPCGFVSFDVREGVVHLTLFGGDREACERLLAEPLRFAERERMPVEVLVGDDDAAMREALDAVGFVTQGAGPRFRGAPTERYRYEAPV